MSRGSFPSCLAALVLPAVPAAAAQAPPSDWDGLSRVKSGRADLVYLRPGADFGSYRKVMLEEPSVAFRRNWIRDFNRSSRSPGGRISESQAQQKLDEVSAAWVKVLANAFTGAGFQLVTHPGPDVLKVRSGIGNLTVNAPDTNRAGRVRTYAPEAGQATLILEARDSESNELLGRVIDHRVAGDMGPYLRNVASNRAEFDRVFRDWARLSVEGLKQLQAGGR